VFSFSPLRDNVLHIAYCQECNSGWRICTVLSFVQAVFLSSACERALGYSNCRNRSHVTRQVLIGLVASSHYVLQFSYSTQMNEFCG
jgi:hypothetical protein